MAKRTDSESAKLTGEGTSGKASAAAKKKTTTKRTTKRKTTATAAKKTTKTAASKTKKAAKATAKTKTPARKKTTAKAVDTEAKPKAKTKSTAKKTTKTAARRTKKIATKRMAEEEPAVDAAELETAETADSLDSIVEEPAVAATEAEAAADDTTKSGGAKRKRRPRRKKKTPVAAAEDASEGDLAVAEPSVADADDAFAFVDDDNDDAGSDVDAGVSTLEPLGEDPFGFGLLEDEQAPEPPRREHRSDRPKDASSKSSSRSAAPKKRQDAEDAWPTAESLGEDDDVFSFADDAEEAPSAQASEPVEAASDADVDDDAADENTEIPVTKERPARKNRRGRRGRRGKRDDKGAREDREDDRAAQPQETVSEAEIDDEESEEIVDSDASESAEEPTTDERTEGEEAPKKRRRRRGGRRRKSAKAKAEAAERAKAEDTEEEDDSSEALAEPVDEDIEETDADIDVSDEEEEAPATDEAIEIISSDNPNLPGIGDQKEMIINITPGAECRIAVLHKNRLEELYIERQSEESHVGNIYKGRVTNVEPSIQAAFVDFGLHRNGFLHISDVQPRYFSKNSNELEEVGKKVPRRDRPPIQKCFRRGDEVLVQVAKEGVGTKGPTLTTYLSIPGRFVVMMPGMNKLGVSRKIEDEDARRRMRDVLNELTLPPEMGFILRTAGLDRTKRELQGDLNYLARLWKRVEARMRRNPAPCELYQESDLVTRTIRDVYSSDFGRIVVDDHATARKAREFLRIAMPRTPSPVYEYRLPKPLFHHFKVEEEIRRLHSRHVPLPSGGSIVIESTEAMVSIDVNSGRFREIHDAEETAYRINLEAAEEIAHQLRLRDLGGLVVCDFIDMRLEKHKRAIERAIRDALKKHKERARILRMSKFGLIEMTRQRQGPSLNRSIFSDCPRCRGEGIVKTAESASLEVMRTLQLLAPRRDVKRVSMRVEPQVAMLVLNARRSFLQDLGEQTGTNIVVAADSGCLPDEIHYECYDDRGMPMRIEL